MNISKPRADAIALGEKYYFTGKPCKNGHVSKRLVSRYSCVQCKKEIWQVSERNRYRYIDTLARQFITRKQQALKDGLPFTISLEEIVRPTHCPILGLELNYEWSGPNRRDPAKASIDKIIPELGYVTGNVKIISLKANRMKSNTTIPILKSIIKYIEENSTNDTSI